MAQREEGRGGAPWRATSSTGSSAALGGVPALGQGRGGILQSAEAHTRRAARAARAQEGASEDEAERRALIAWAKAEEREAGGPIHAFRTINCPAASVRH